VKSPNGKGGAEIDDYSHDVNEWDIPRLVDRLAGLAKRGADPSAIEPGYYTVIMEPWAVARMVYQLWGREADEMEARKANTGRNIYSKSGGGNKTGLQMIDRRISIQTDPWDPMCHYDPFDNAGRILKKQIYFEKGVLKTLAYDDTYARQKGVEPVSPPRNVRVNIEGTPQTVDEMIASTKRGLWIQNMGIGNVLDRNTLQMSSVTQNGVFLIEDGKISRPVHNLRWVESPLAMLNKIEAFSTPERIYMSAIPKMKIRDVRFTSMATIL
jgi:predicted Zn-dependent protease